jgi:tRNA threonylcarbamoyladenosine biosynthesis protein TsaE
MALTTSLVVRTSSVGETQRLAADVAALALPGDVLVLAGDLGAGKTAFTQGFGRGLGVTEPITSPTFTLAQQYEGRLTVHHLDVYRLDQLGEVADLGLPELLDDRGVVLIEWGDAILAVLPNEYLEVRLNFGAGDDERRILLRSVGSSWVRRQVALLEAVDPWAEPPPGSATSAGSPAPPAPAAPPAGSQVDGTGEGPGDRGGSPPC